jgi:hypothetical protein
VDPARRKVILGFVLRFVMLLAVELMPLPWLADSYATGFAALSNVALAPVNLNSWVHFHMEAPAEIRSKGEWAVNLRMDELQTGATSAIPVNVRILSYLPMAMFLALALAAPLSGRWRVARVLGIGVPVMAVITTVLAASPVLARFGAVGTFGAAGAPLTMTLYRVLATPVMIFFMPALVWWLVVWRTRTRAKVEKADAW